MAIDIAILDNLEQSINDLKNCGVGSGGFQPGNRGARGGGGGSSSEGGSGGSKPKKPKTKLPKNPKKLNINTAQQALNEMGYKLNPASAKWDPAQKKTTYELTGPDGKTQRIAASDISKIVYGKGPKAAPKTSPPKADNKPQGKTKPASESKPEAKGKSESKPKRTPLNPKVQALSDEHAIAVAKKYGFSSTSDSQVAAIQAKIFLSEQISKRGLKKDSKPASTEYDDVTRKDIEKQRAAARAGDDSKMKKTAYNLKMTRKTQLGPPDNVKDVDGRLAAKVYTGHKYKAINKALRKGKDPSEGKPQPHVDNLQKLAKQELPSPKVVYRGVTAEVAQQFIGKKGDIIESKGFMSTSLDADVATQFIRRNTLDEGKKQPGVLMEIVAKRGLYAEGLSTYDSERELIQAHGTKYKYAGKTKIKKGGQSYTVIQLEEV